MLCFKGGNRLNPLKRVNSILTISILMLKDLMSPLGLNPLKRVNSILTMCYNLRGLLDLVNVSIPSNGSIQFLPTAFNYANKIEWLQSQSPQTGQFNSYLTKVPNIKFREVKVSIPSNGSIQFLLVWRILDAKHPINVSQSPQTGQFNSYKRLTL